MYYFYIWRKIKIELFRRPYHKKIFLPLSRNILNFYLKFRFFFLKLIEKSAGKLKFDKTSFNTHVNQLLSYLILFSRVIPWYDPGNTHTHPGRGILYPTQV